MVIRKVSRRKKPVVKAPRKLPWSQEVKDECESYIKEGMTFRATAAKTGVPYQTIAVWFSAVPAAPAPLVISPRVKGDRMTEMDVYMAWRMHIEQHMTLKQIAKEMNCAVMTVERMDWKNNPHCMAQRERTMQSNIDKIDYQSSRVLDKMDNAPVPTAQHGGVTVRQLSDARTILTHDATNIVADNGKMTMVDFMKLHNAEQEKRREAERLRLVALPQIVESTATERGKENDL